MRLLPAGCRVGKEVFSLNYATGNRLSDQPTRIDQRGWAFRSTTFIDICQLYCEEISLVRGDFGDLGNFRIFESISDFENVYSNMRTANTSSIP